MCYTQKETNVWLEIKSMLREKDTLFSGNKNTEASDKKLRNQHKIRAM